MINHIDEILRNLKEGPTRRSVGKETEIRGRMLYFNQLWQKTWYHVVKLVWQPYISTTYRWMDILIDDNRGIAPIQCIFLPLGKLLSLWHSLSNIFGTVSFSEWNVPSSSVARNTLVPHDLLGIPLLYLSWTFLSSASESDSFKGWVKEENFENSTSVAFYLLFLVWFFPSSSSLRVLLM